jgi:hypothetical protein
MTEPRTSSSSTEIKIATAVGGLISQFIVGALFIAGGAWLTRWALLAEQHRYVYVGIGVAIFGALCLPSIFPIARNIYITIFPNGLPMLGGKRAGDPPVPPTTGPTS